IDRPILVWQRQTYPPGSATAEGLWQYGRRRGRVQCPSGPQSNIFSRQLTSWVLPPRTTDPVTGQQDPQYAIINYFSLYDGDIDLCLNPEQWQGAEYGLPFTRYASRAATNNDPVSLRYLSSQLVQDFAPDSLTTWDGHGSVSSAGTGAPTIIKSTYLIY